jgi:hypothetical protein
MWPYPRIRKTVKWGGTVVSVVLELVWMASGWGWLGVYTDHFDVGVASGIVHVEVLAPPRPPGPYAWGGGIGAHPYFWKRSMSSQMAALSTRLDFLLWIPAHIATAITATAWCLDARARRRAMIGACPNCSYSRAGLAPSAVCPECGSPAPAPSAPA